MASDSRPRKSRQLNRDAVDPSMCLSSDQQAAEPNQLCGCWKIGRARCQPWQGVIDMMSRVIASEATG